MSAPVASLDEVYASRERAITAAVQLECQIAAVNEIHHPLEVGVGSDNFRTVCHECGCSYPCPTARAIGADLLDDDTEGVKE